MNHSVRKNQNVNINIKKLKSKWVFCKHFFFFTVNHRWIFCSIALIILWKTNWYLSIICCLILNNNHSKPSPSYTNTHAPYTPYTWVTRGNRSWQFKDMVDWQEIAFIFQSCISFCTFFNHLLLIWFCCIRFKTKKFLVFFFF